MPAKLHVENVGGIEETSVAFDPGVTVLEGRNATNRTSLLQATMAACGSTNVSIKADAETATVELTVGGDRYRRTLRRQGETVVGEGEGYLDDPELAELFAFLLESNEARRAVVTGQDLRELIMRPVDTTAIQAQITQLEAEKDQLDERLAEIEGQKAELRTLRAKRDQLEAEIADTETELAAVQAELEEAESDVGSREAEPEAVEDTLSKLRDRREELEEVRYDRETAVESIEALREERESVSAELDDLLTEAETDADAIEAELDDLREERQRLERRVTELNAVIQFNEEMLEGSNQHVQTALQDDDGRESAAVTDRLLDAEDTVTCWTCGSDVTTDRVAETVELLRGVRGETASKMDDVASDIEDRKKAKEKHRERRERGRNLRRRLDDIESEIADREARLDDLDDRRQHLEETIESLEEEIEERRSDARTDLLDRHERANELEFELNRLQSRLESIDEEIATVESRIEEESSLERRREEVRSELEEYRTRIERIQEEAVEAFNEHMGRVLDILEYDNIGRVWIERIETTVSSGRTTETKPTFDLRLVRDPDEGAAYRDSVDHLSESEREVVGLVFALAGFLAHDVGDECPFMLLDSLEAFDGERIDALLSYLEDHSEYLVVALLPEDAAVVTGEYTRVTDL